MSLLEMLSQLGDRLGIVEMSAPQSNEARPKIQTRTVTLAELTTEVRAKEISALADLPAELSIPFDRVYESAGVKPAAHGWTVQKLSQALPAETAILGTRLDIQKQILGILASQGADVEDIVKDAVARDQALDAFEVCVRKKMQDRQAVRERRCAELQAKIQQLQAEVAGLEESNGIDESKWQEWRQQKRAAEKELARTVGYLIDKAVITMED